MFLSILLIELVETPHDFARFSVLPIPSEAKTAVTTSEGKDTPRLRLMGSGLSMNCTTEGVVEVENID
jgi:hypothetical protein